jgi:uncharacterized membrane protein YphA (DoxX/SURF4 family)
MLRFAGRRLMAGVFIVAGIDVLRDPGDRVAKAADIGLAQPENMVKANAAAMVAGGAALALGVLPRLAAAGLTASMVVTTYAGHAFWNEDDAKARKAQLAQFLKNAAIVGGLLYVVAD